MLRAYNIGPGDEVIVPAHTFIASALAVAHVGATPVLCDVLEDTGLIDPDAARAAVGPRTVGILAVHLYGQACDMDALQAVAKPHGLLLLEDAAQAAGARYRGRPVGSLGAAAGFSFYPGKNLGALGDGGAVCTDDALLASRLRRLRNLGQRVKGEHVELGFNERLDGLQAALLRVKLEYLDEWNEARRARAEDYRELLPAGHRDHGGAAGESRASITCSRRGFRTATGWPTGLREAGIETGVHYDRAVHEHAAWEDHAAAPRRSSDRRGVGGARSCHYPCTPTSRGGGRARGARNRNSTSGGRGKSERNCCSQDSRTSPMAEPTGVAVIGLGYWGPNLLRVLADKPEAQVRWICDLDRERLNRYRRRYPSVRITSHIERVLADPGVETVIIATPVNTHYDLAAQALEAGKHVFVEKPLAPSAALADDLAQMAADRGLLLMCGHTFVYSPPVRAIKRMLEAGTLGDIYFISSSRVNLGLHQRDVSVIWDLGPHDFSILLYWLNELPTSVRAVGRDSIVPGIADVAFVTLTFGSGIVANVELSWLAPSKLRRTVLVGSERMVTYDDGAVEPVRVFDSGVVYKDPETFGEYHLSYRSGDIVSPKIESHEPLGLELGDFLGAIRSGESMEFHTALARSVVRIVEAADRSLKQGGREVSLDTGEVNDQLSARPALALA